MAKLIYFVFFKFAGSGFFAVGLPANTTDVIEAGRIITYIQMFTMAQHSD